MPWLRIAFLIAALSVTSGYRFRCYAFCEDQTGTQNDYVEQRDYCREYAQLKVNMTTREAQDAGEDTDDKSRKAMLVSLFSTCMGKNGWIVPDGKSEAAKAAAAATPTATAATLAANKAEQKAALTRASECSFARNSASVSSIAKLRAEACDLECEEALRTAPGSVRPPSCPSDLPPKYAKGAEE